MGSHYDLHGDHLVDSGGNVVGHVDSSGEAIDSSTGRPMADVKYTHVSNSNPQGCSSVSGGYTAGKISQANFIEHMNDNPELYDRSVEEISKEAKKLYRRDYLWGENDGSMLSDQELKELNKRKLELKREREAEKQREKAIRLFMLFVLACLIVGFLAVVSPIGAAVIGVVSVICMLFAILL